MHVHLVKFQVVKRLDGIGTEIDPFPWELGWKDTVNAFPGQTTIIRAKFDIESLYVWHSHILSHEDNVSLMAGLVFENVAEFAIVLTFIFL